MAQKSGSIVVKLVVVAVLIAGAWAAWTYYGKRQRNAPVDYKTAAISRGEIVQSVTANGQINPVKNITVGSQVSGIITEINVDFNTKVTNGQVIAQIDPSTYQRSMVQSQADLTNSLASLELAQLNFRRAKELRANDLIPASDYDQAEVSLHQAQAVVMMRQAALEKVQVDLDRTSILAPLDGVVISRAVEVGQTVAASFNTPTLFQIANDLRKMRIEALVSEADVGGVVEGQKTRFTVEAYTGRNFEGTVSQVRFAPITNQNVVNYTIIIDVNNDDMKLRPGMTANAQIITAERPNVLRISNAALRFRPPDVGGTNAVTAKTGAGTNKVAGSGTNLAMAAGGPPGGPGAGGGGGGGEGGGMPNREEMRKRFESMTPEQREQARAAFRARMGGEGGGGGGGGGGFGGMGRMGGGGRDRSEGPATRTVYIMEKPATGDAPAVLKPVTIKTGSTDNSQTEVLEGLKEGDIVVTGINQPASAMAGAGSAAGGAQRPQSSSPFGGPFGGGMRPR